MLRHGWVGFKLLLICVLFKGIVSQDCQERITSTGQVCVCNSTYCDVVPQWIPTSGQYSVYTTSKKTLGFQLRSNTFLPPPLFLNPFTTISIDLGIKHQTIIGFGGAFTDSTGININSLPEDAQNNLMESYFGVDGIEYSLCRVPIGGTDFSPRAYSYDDNADDFDLALFSLQPEDYAYKIPYIQQALSLRGDLPFKLFASAWTAPPWMKTNDQWSGAGVLINSFYQLWADYHMRFLEAYQEYGVNFWGLTTGNEPTDGFVPSNLSQLNAMGWTPREMNDWIGYFLGPTLQASEFSNIKVMVHDDNRATLPLLPLQIENDVTLQFIDGVGIHWYEDNFFPDYYLDYTISSKKDLFLLATEACNSKYDPTNSLLFDIVQPDYDVKGNWDRAVSYIKSIFLDCNNRAGGWVDWNMVLNEEGGPTYIKNYVDSPVIVNSTAGEFYKQPMFYALGHFSKFCVPDSIRLETTLGIGLQNITAMAFLRPDNAIALIVFNSGDFDITVQFAQGFREGEEVIEANSLNTILWPL